VRFGLAAEPCPRGGGAAAFGAGMLEGRLAPAARDAVQRGLQVVQATAAFERNVSDREWEGLARVALLFAVFEQCFRSGILPDQFEDLNTVPSGWREWADLVCADAELEDVAMVGWAAVQDHGSIRGRELICNPVFAQSAALGGADADLITDTGQLIDFKSTSTTRTCSAIDIWQLCGYALADTDGDYRIRSVGLSALRWRTQCSWALGELFPMLAGEPVSVEQFRRDFAAVLAELLRSRPRGGRRNDVFAAKASSEQSGAPNSTKTDACFGGARSVVSWELLARASRSRSDRGQPRCGSFFLRIGGNRRASPSVLPAGRRPDRSDPGSVPL